MNYEGDHSDIISVINNMVTANIKICFSSRSWNVFEDEYGSNNGYKLQIHEHTRSDIVQFIQDHLEKDHRFMKLKEEDPGYRDLVLEITDRANGVFLWVFLVIRSLRRGFSNADIIADFKKRLRLIPTDLKAYFRHMPDCIEEVYQEQACRIYLTCLTTVPRLSVTMVSFFDQDDSDFALDQSPHLWKPNVIDNDGAVARKRIKARCPDLLEIVPSSTNMHRSKYEVDFLHRTARDFLCTEDVTRLLRTLAGDFNADFYLCQAYIAELKLFLKYLSSHEAKFTMITEIVDSFLFHARNLEGRKVSLDKRYTDEMHRFLLQSNSYCPAPSDKSRELRRFVGLAISHGLIGYLRSNMTELRSLVREETFFLQVPLLRRALIPHENQRPTSRYTPTGLNPELVAVLLEAGATPNKLDERCSVWIRFLRTIPTVQIGNNDTKGRYARAVELCIQNGASTNVRTPSFTHRSSRHVVSYKTLSMFVTETFSRTEAASIHEAIHQSQEFAV